MALATGAPPAAAAPAAPSNAAAEGGAAAAAAAAAVPPAPAHTMVRSFALVYTEMAFERAAPADKLAVVGASTCLPRMRAFALHALHAHAVLCT